MIEIKIAVLLACSGCKLIGELWWHNAQRFIMPLLYSISVSVVSGCWWLGFTTIPMIGPITLGYKDYGPSNGFDRGCWLFAICAIAGLGPVLTHHLSWFAYVPICGFAGIWGGTTRNWWNVVIAPISGLIIGSMILFIHIIHKKVI